jgi:HSP20 family protein
MAELTPATLKDPVAQGSPESTRGGAHFTPRVDIYETDKELLLFADVPGVTADGLDLRFEKGELLLHGRVPDSEDGRRFLLNEYDVGDFYRVFSIHESVDASKISAEIKNGVLTIHLPKVEAAQPRKINVKVQ